MRAAILTWSGLFGNHALRPADLVHLREWTALPVAVKGILHPDDARQVVDAGADAVVVSNHGGRQVDGAIAAVDALPAVVATIGDRADVLFDSGIRTGSDMLTALTLGAKAVLYGRPWAYASASRAERVCAYVFCSRISTPSWDCPAARIQPSSTVR